MPRLLLTLLILAALVAGLWWWLESPVNVGEPSSQHPVTREQPSVPQTTQPIPKNEAEQTAEDKRWLELKAKADASALGKDVRLNVTQDKQKTWEVLVEQAIYSEDRKIAHLKAISGTFFDETGQPSAKFSAPYGTFSQIAQELTLMGGTHLATEPGSKQPGVVVDAPILKWNKATKRWLNLLGGIQINLGKLGKTQAKQARFSTNFQEMELKGNVETVITGGKLPTA